jgi:hypothetical protein
MQNKINPRSVPFLSPDPECSPWSGNDASKKNHFTITDFREIVVFNYRKTNVIDVLNMKDISDVLVNKFRFLG